LSPEKDLIALRQRTADHCFRIYQIPTASVNRVITPV